MSSPETAADRLRAFIREQRPGGCKWLSKGPDACECPLCDVDRLMAFLRAAAPPAHAEVRAQESRDQADADQLRAKFGPVSAPPAPAGEDFRSELRALAAACHVLIGDPEDCEDCGDLLDRPCRMHMDPTWHRALDKADAALKGEPPPVSASPAAPELERELYT